MEAGEGGGAQDFQVQEYAHLAAWFENVSISPSTGNFFFNAYNNEWILEFTSAGEYRRKLGGSRDLKHPIAIAFNVKEDTILVLDYAFCVVTVFGGSDARLKGTISGPGREKGKLSIPTGMTVDQRNGNVIVTQTGGFPGCKINVFSSKGTFLRGFGREDQLVVPRGVTVDSRNGNLWVADAKNDCIVLFSAWGALLRKFGASGTAHGQFTWPNKLGLLLPNAGWTNRDVFRSAPKEFQLIVKAVYMMASHDASKEPRHPEAPFHQLPLEILFLIIEFLSLEYLGALVVTDSHGTAPVQILHLTGDHVATLGGTRTPQDKANRAATPMCVAPDNVVYYISGDKLYAAGPRSTLPTKPTGLLLWRVK